MLGVTTVSGNELIAVFETRYLDGPYSVMSVSSFNDGYTWGNRRTVFVPPQLKANAGAPQVVRIGTTLIVSFHTDEKAPGIFAAKVLTSGDGGKTWGHELVVSEPLGFWPGLVALNATSLLALADAGGAKAQRIDLA
jgi:photosystem II stability/assembly factor-like uncharacterized protein